MRPTSRFMRLSTASPTAASIRGRRSRRLRIPVLWQLGTADKRMYEPETVADLATITGAGAHDFSIRLYAGGAHSLRSTAHGLIAEEKTSPGFVPGVFSDLGAWLHAHA